MQHLSRDEVRSVYCSECKAQPGALCVSYRGPRAGNERTANHRARVNLAYRMFAQLEVAPRNQP